MSNQAKTDPAWDFTRLPANEHQEAIAAYEAGDVRKLVDIHDRNRLSEYSYCCDQRGLLAWFGEAIKNGTIHGQKQNS